MKKETGPRVFTERKFVIVSKTPGQQLAELIADCEIEPGKPPQARVRRWESTLRRWEGKVPTRIMKTMVLRDVAADDPRLVAVRAEVDREVEEWTEREKKKAAPTK